MVKRSPIILVFAVLVFVLGLFVIAPQYVYGADLQFTPSSGSNAVGTTFSVDVFVSSTDQAINAASGVIRFPQDLLEVVSFSTKSSAFNFCVQEPTFSNKEGTVGFECIVLNPGFVGAKGKIITILFKVKVSGKASLIFSSGSVLANDGKGSDVLTRLGKANFVLKAPMAKKMIQTIRGAMEVDATSYAYGVGRLKDRKKEQVFRDIVKSQLTEQLRIIGKKPTWVAKQWERYTVAFLYGGYSIEEILRSLIQSKIMHAKKAASVWRKSTDYSRLFSQSTWIAMIDGKMSGTQQIKGSDSDRDGLPDLYEEKIIGTNPKKKDTDGDGYNDGEEVRSEHSPLQPSATRKQVPMKLVPKKK